MLSVTIDEERGIAVFQPDGALSKSDFEGAAKIVNAFLEKNGRLNGLIIHVEHFPGWDSFAALAAHLTFIQDHHKKIARIAFVTDSLLGSFADVIGSHFVSAEIKSFAFAELETALAWIAEQ